MAQIQIIDAKDNEMTVVLENRKPWLPFKEIPIRLMGTRKTTQKNNLKPSSPKGNCLDTIRGCPGGRTNEGYGCWWGCYSKEAMNRWRILFDIPVPMRLISPLLEKDLIALNQDWVRIGVHGDPSIDWDLAIKTVKLLSKHKKQAVILTRFWRMASTKQLTELANNNAIIHGTLCALDSEDFRLHIISQLEKFRNLGGKSVLRLVSFAFKQNDPLWFIQNKLARYSLVLEQPARLKKTNPTWLKIDQKRYLPYSVIKGSKPTWQCAGPLYPEVAGCTTPCWECQNQCLTV